MAARSGKRLSERCFNLILWLVALASAVLLTGLGSLIVGDLRQVERHFTLTQLSDSEQAGASADALK